MPPSHSLLFGTSADQPLSTTTQCIAERALLWQPPGRTAGDPPVCCCSHASNQTLGVYMQLEPRFDHGKHYLNGLPDQLHERTDAERVRAQPDRADDIKHQMEVQTAVEELGAQLQVGAQWAGLLLLCCGKVMPTQRHALRPAGNKHLDSHREQAAHVAGNFGHAAKSLVPQRLPADDDSARQSILLSMRDIS